MMENSPVNEVSLLYNYLAVGGVLFALGLIGFLVRRNMIVMFLCAEMMLQGVSINLIGWGRYHGSLGLSGAWGGQMLVIFIITIAACEASLAMVLVLMLVRRTGRPTHLMTRGIDTELFRPSRRTVTDGIFRLGFVGRITPEKSVRLFAQVEAELLARGVGNFRFLIVGDGSEREWLRRHLQYVDLPGILRGEELAAAYANMDVFLFPSRTDTFGNVVQEAMASGTPSIVTNAGGPKFIVRDGVTGWVTRSDEEFVQRTVELMQDRRRLADMGAAGLEQAATASWDRVFEGVYAGYREAAGLTVEGMAAITPRCPPPRCAGSSAGDAR